MNVRVVKKPDRFQVIPVQTAMPTREPPTSTTDGFAVYWVPAEGPPDRVSVYGLTIPEVMKLSAHSDPADYGLAMTRTELVLERTRFRRERCLSPRERRGIARGRWGRWGRPMMKGRRSAQPVAMASRWEWEIFAPKGTPERVLERATEGMEINPTLTVWARDGWRRGADVFADPARDRRARCAGPDGSYRGWLDDVPELTDRA